MQLPRRRSDTTAIPQLFVFSYFRIFVIRNQITKARKHEENVFADMPQFPSCRAGRLQC
jgi:hypothetical protein